MLQCKITELQNLYHKIFNSHIIEVHGTLLKYLTLEQLQTQIDYLKKWDYYTSNCINPLPDEELIEKYLS